MDSKNTIFLFDVELKPERFDELLNILSKELK